MPTDQTKLHAFLRGWGRVKVSYFVLVFFCCLAIILRLLHLDSSPGTFSIYMTKVSTWPVHFNFYEQAERSIFQGEVMVRGVECGRGVEGGVERWVGEDPTHNLR